MKIIRLTRERVLTNIRDLIDIDQIVEADERWVKENFLMELEGKWNNSFAVLFNGQIVGFVICSIKYKNNLHIHRLAVKKKYQNKGFGTKLIEHIFKNAEDYINFASLKVKKDNIVAQKFYENFEKPFYLRDTKIITKQLKTF